MENGCLQENITKYFSSWQGSPLCLSSCIFYCHGFITGERLNENTLLFKSSSASVTNTLLFTALNVVLVKWLSSQRIWLHLGNQQQKRQMNFSEAKMLRFISMCQNGRKVKYRPFGRTPSKLNVFQSFLWAFSCSRTGVLVSWKLYWI